MARAFTIARKSHSENDMEHAFGHVIIDISSLIPDDTLRTKNHSSNIFSDFFFLLRRVLSAATMLNFFHLMKQISQIECLDYIQ